ncbi:uncharacterized protein LOC144433226 [Glandiceps talaboti]
MSVINERLLASASEGKLHVVSRLLKSGRCAINYVSENDLCTPLLKASAHGHVKVVSVLLECGANPNLSDKTGLTPLHLACQSGHATIAVMLLDLHADINARDKYGRTPLHLAAINGRKAVTEVLVKREADVNVVPMETVSKKYGNVYQNPWQGLTPLHCASDWGHAGVVSVMINSKADVDFRDTVFGRTPLHMAAVKGHRVVTNLLIKAGADLDAEAIILVGMIWGSLVQNPWPNCTAIQCAAYWGHQDVVLSLVKAGADISTRDSEYGGTPLHLACVKGHMGVVKALFERKVDINAKADMKVDKLCGSVFNTVWQKCTPLHCATFCGHKNIVQFLLQRGAYVYCHDSEGKTAYDIAIEKQKPDLAAMILIQCKEFLLNTQFVKYSERVGHGTRWKRLAVALFFPEEDIEKIEETYKELEAEERSKKSCIHVLKAWLSEQTAWPALQEVDEAMQKVEKIGKGGDIHFGTDVSSDSAGHNQGRRQSRFPRH